MIMCIKIYIYIFISLFLFRCSDRGELITIKRELKFVDSIEKEAIQYAKVSIVNSALEDYSMKSFNDGKECIVVAGGIVDNSAFLTMVNSMVSINDLLLVQSPGFERLLLSKKDLESGTIELKPITRCGYSIKCFSQSVDGAHDKLLIEYEIRNTHKDSLWKRAWGIDTLTYFSESTRAFSRLSSHEKVKILTRDIQTNVVLQTWEFEFNPMVTYELAVCFD
jgi:hypothetical protein